MSTNIRQVIAAKLGLADDASPDEVMTALTAALDKRKAKNAPKLRAVPPAKSAEDRAYEDLWPESSTYDPTSGLSAEDEAAYRAVFGG